jgi:hypothetical protein
MSVYLSTQRSPTPHVALIDAEVQKWKPDDANMGNHDWFMAMIVRREAEALINSAAPPSKKQDPHGKP